MRMKLHHQEHCQIDHLRAAVMEEERVEEEEEEEGEEKDKGNCCSQLQGLDSRSSSRKSEGGVEEEEVVSVLPRDTKVVVTGNNRTKSVLVGLQGVVKKAVGLGGWHWLVLTNGIEVKLQRNALSVIEAPTGNEDDDDFQADNMHWQCSDLASNMSENAQRLHKPKQKQYKETELVQKGSTRSNSSDSHFQGSVTHEGTKVDLSKLETTALWRYWRHFNLVDAVPNPSKERLVEVVQRHFMSQQLDELQVIVGFVQAAKRLKSVCG